MPGINGIKDRHKTEVERFIIFQQGVLGIKAKPEVGDLDIRNYAKYLLREGDPSENREFPLLFEEQVTTEGKENPTSQMSLQII